MDQESNQLQRRIAQLEFEQDQLVTELQYIDSLLRDIGFNQGLESIKNTAEELLIQADNIEFKEEF